MADVTNFAINKEWDLSFIYDMARQARSSGEIKQSIKLSEKGLDEAKKIKDKDMILKFDTFHSEINEVYFRKKFEKYAKRANMEENIFRYEKAIHFLKKAKKHLNKMFKLGKNESKVKKELKKIDKKIYELKEKEKLSNLEIISEGNHESDSSDNLENERDIEDSHIISDYKNDFISEKQEDIQNIVQIPDEVIELNVKEKIDLFNNNYEDNHEKGVVEDITNDNIETNSIIDSFLDPEDHSFQKNLPKLYENELEIQGNQIEHEKLKNFTYKSLVKDTKKILNSLDYFIIPKTSHIVKKSYKNIDFIAVKIIYVNDLLNIIKIFPLKISDLKGSFLLSEDKFSYHPLNRKLKIDKFNKELITKSSIKKIKKASEFIFQDITNEGEIFKFFKRYLKLDICIEKTLNNKRLFFHSGPLQYKVLIEPIIICQNEPGFIEKSIPFPYQKSTNLHIIDLAKLRDLLQFLEKKNQIIETNSENPTAINSYFKTVEKFSNDLKIYSIPFAIFGFIFSLIFVFQAYPVLPIFVDLGYAVICIYSLLVFYLYLKFYKKKSELIIEFKTPYYQRKISIDESDLLMIKSELPKELIHQFLYECFGKKAEFPLFSVLDDETDTLLYNNIKPSEFKEVGEVNSMEETNLVKFASKNLENNITEKYSSFLED
jgi:hypothetical protein